MQRSERHDLEIEKMFKLAKLMSNNMWMALLSLGYEAKKLGTISFAPFRVRLEDLKKTLEAIESDIVKSRVNKSEGFPFFKSDKIKKNTENTYNRLGDIVEILFKLQHELYNYLLEFFTANNLDSTEIKKYQESYISNTKKRDSQQLSFKGIGKDPKKTTDEELLKVLITSFKAYDDAIYRSMIKTLKLVPPIQGKIIADEEKEKNSKALGVLKDLKIFFSSSKNQNALQEVFASNPDFKSTVDEFLKIFNEFLKKHPYIKKAVEKLFADDDPELIQNAFLEESFRDFLNTKQLDPVFMAIEEEIAKERNKVRLCVELLIEAKDFFRAYTQHSGALTILFEIHPAAKILMDEYIQIFKKNYAFDHEIQNALAQLYNSDKSKTSSNLDESKIISNLGNTDFLNFLKNKLEPLKPFIILWNNKQEQFRKLDFYFVELKDIRRELAMGLSKAFGEDYKFRKIPDLLSNDTDKQMKGLSFAIQDLKKRLATDKGLSLDKAWMYFKLIDKCLKRYEKINALNKDLGGKILTLDPSLRTNLSKLESKYFESHRQMDKKKKEAYRKNT